MTFMAVLSTELLKLRRSRVTWLTFAAYTFMVAMAGFFMWMMMNPGAAESIGLLGQKAKLSVGGQALDWSGFLTFIVEMSGIGGLIMCSIVVTYVFGREYAEGTAKNMLTLPIPRSSFVLAKVIVSAAWFASMTLWMVIETAAVGLVLGLPGLTVALFVSTVGKVFALSLMSLCCAMLVAWVAVQAHGYFAPLGFSILTLVLASIFGHTGWGPWAPWSIVGIFSGAAGPGGALTWGSYAVLAATLVSGILLTMRHEVASDNVQ
jgi:ABC-type transport system involved in multi-copper enzyme maturation permease subunit